MAITNVKARVGELAEKEDQLQLAIRTIKCKKHLTSAIKHSNRIKGDRSGCLNSQNIRH